MKKIVFISLAFALSGCVNIYEAKPADPAPGRCCRQDDDRIYRMQNGRWYRLREGICPCVDRP